MPTLSERLEAAANAYPEDLFHPVTDEDRALHGALVTRAAAQMGRHMSKMLLEAAALAKRYEDAPVGFVMGQGLLTESRAAIVSMEDPATVKGQRVRIVLDKGG